MVRVDLKSHHYGSELPEARLKCVFPQILSQDYAHTALCCDTELKFITENDRIPLILLVIAPLQTQKSLLWY